VGLVCGVLHDRLRDEPVVEGVAVVHRQPHEHQQMFGADAILTAAPRAVQRSGMRRRLRRRSRPPMAAIEAADGGAEAVLEE
jgi:hypothetical protein